MVFRYVVPLAVIMVSGVVGELMAKASKRTYQWHIKKALKQVLQIRET